jgi:membrane protein
VFGINNKRFVKELWAEMQEDNVFNGAAALAYYLMLSIFPGAIFLLTLLPYLPTADLQKAIMDLLHQAMPEQAANLFEGVVKNVMVQKKGGLLTFGVLFTLWSASTGLYAVMQQLNITYDVKEGRPFWKVRGTAVLLMLLFVILVVGAFILIVGGGMIQDQLTAWIGTRGEVLAFFAVLRWLIIACFILLGFALVYYLGPDVEQTFKFVTPGSVIGLILLVISSLAFSFYIGNFGNYSATYGGLGAVIILMLWLYIAGLVLLIGSEINALLEHYHPEGKSKGEKKA